MDPLSVVDVRGDEASLPALITDEGAWSFADVRRASLAWAAMQRDRGVVAGARVAFQAPSDPGIFVAIHGLLATGATLVPLHPRLTPDEIARTIEVSRPDLVLDEEDLARAARALRVRDPGESVAIDRSGTKDAPLAIVPTSGTSGVPKGAILSRRAFVASAVASTANLGWRAEDRWLSCLPLAHVGGLSVITRCLIARRPVVLLPRFDPDAVMRCVRDHRVTLWSAVPTMLHAMLEGRAAGPLRALRAILVGGAAASPALMERCAREQIRALTTYGLTEATSQVTTQSPRDPSLVLRGSGAPLPGVRVRIVGDNGAPIARDVGRIQVAGPTLFDGYVGDASQPFDDAGWFDTGDLGERDDEGHLHVHARRTDLIVTGGENVYPVEVEQALARCTGVRAALVFGVPDERWGAQVCALLEVDRGAWAKTSFFAEIQGNLAKHKRPRRVAIVGAIPLLATGKPDRRAAIDRYAASLEPVDAG